MNANTAGIHHVTLIVAEAALTAELLTGTLGFERVGQAEGRVRFAGGAPGTLVDISDASGFPRGTMGAGTPLRLSGEDPR